MDKLKIVFLDRDTLPDTIEFTGPDIAHELVCYPNTPADQIVNRIKDCDVVISNKVKLNADILNKVKRLKLIVVAATGCDNIDLNACAENNITVTNVRDYANDSVPEHTIALILALQRNLLAYRESIKKGRWQEVGRFCYFDYPIQDLASSTLAIIGAGALGQNVAKLATAFGLKVQFVTRQSYTKIVDEKTGLTEFDHILKTSDIISLHCPLTESNKGMINKDIFSKMAKKPILINTARGGLVNENDLAQALISGQIKGAGLDVASQEPIPKDHPYMGLLELPNFILTPHVAWTSSTALNNLVAQVKNNIDSFYKNQACNVVTN